MSNLKELTKGLLKENPIFVQFLGMCATLAVSTSVINGIGMGLSTMVVLVASNIIISLIRNFIPNKVRIAAYIIVIAGCVSAVEMALKAFVPEVSKSLGIFIPLIVVNCIILGRAEAFASKNGVVKSALDGIGMGLGFTLALCILGTIREILGNGTFLGIQLFGEGFAPATIMILPPGAFIVLGCVLAIINLITAKKERSDK
ncbi:MAG: electron transport complex subunit E [Clostridia bacterium]|nr:electron transport complex subunit E [Clostridia bacterium]